MFSKYKKNEISKFIAENFYGEDINYLKYNPIELYDYSSSCLSGDWISCDKWEPFLQIKRQVGADHIMAGATKIVFIWDDFDFVIKIPFYGKGYYEEAYEKPQLKGIEEFGNSFCNEEPWNYCAAEEQVYRAAYEKDLEYFFCGTQYICSIGDIKFYASEKMDEEFFYDYSKKPSEESYNKAYFSPYYVDMNDNCAAMLFEQNDKEEVYKLQQFLRSWNLNDFHCGNFGYINNHLRIIDYSGFFE